VQKYENDLFVHHTSGKDLEDDENPKWFEDVCLPE